VRCNKLAVDTSGAPADAIFCLLCSLHLLNLRHFVAFGDQCGSCSIDVAARAADLLTVANAANSEFPPKLASANLGVFSVELVERADADEEDDVSIALFQLPILLLRRRQLEVLREL
jgi:precorrin-6B methylase 2